MTHIILLSLVAKDIVGDRRRTPGQDEIVFALEARRARSTKTMIVKTRTAKEC